MTEEEYILVMDLKTIRHAKYMLKDVMHGLAEPIVTEAIILLWKAEEIMDKEFNQLNNLE